MVCFERSIDRINKAPSAVPGGASRTAQCPTPKSGALSGTS
jgi:hypothetical protein